MDISTLQSELNRYIDIQEKKHRLLKKGLITFFIFTALIVLMLFYGCFQSYLDMTMEYGDDLHLEQVKIY